MFCFVISIQRQAGEDEQAKARMWNSRHQQLRQEGVTEKAAQLIQKESFKHKLLRNLKELDGPFTCEEEVDRYMESKGEEKQKRMKMEVHYLKAFKKWTQ